MRIVTTVLLAMVFAGCAAKQEPPYQVSKVADGFKFPEGPASDGKGNIYVSNCDADPGIVSKVDAAGNSSVAFTGSAKTFQKTNGMTVGQDGAIYACDFGKKIIVRIAPDGAVSTYAENYQ